VGATITPEINSYLFSCEEKSFDIRPVISELERKCNVKIRVLHGRRGFNNLPEEESKMLIKEIDEEIINIIEMNFSYACK